MIKELAEKIRERNPKRVFIQLPEGLATRSAELEELLYREGIEVFVSLEPCYGACDLRDWEAERLGCDLLVHVGHSDFGLDSRVDVLYCEWRLSFDPVPLLEKNLKMLPEKIGLVSTVNFLDSLEKARVYLEKQGKKCFLGKGPSYPGQVLGCDLKAGKEIEKQADCFLFLGTGKFHPVGLALETRKPVFSLGPEKGFQKTDADIFVRQREAAKALARDCRNFGILVSTKPGQSSPEKALKIKGKLEKQGKKAFIFTMNRITPEKLEGLGMDCYVNTACPRIAVENRTSFRVPILNPEELDFLKA